MCECLSVSVVVAQFPVFTVIDGGKRETETEREGEMPFQCRSRDASTKSFFLPLFLFFVLYRVNQKISKNHSVRHGNGYSRELGEGHHWGNWFFGLATTELAGKFE